MARRKPYDAEFHTPDEAVNRENPTPADYMSYRYRASDAKEEAPTGHEYSPPPEKDSVKKEEKKNFRNTKGHFIMQMAAAAMAVIVVKDAYGYDLLGYDVFAHGSSSSSSSSYSYSDSEPSPNYAYWPADDIADTEFPVLTNLEPNGYVPGYGIINEQYVRMEYYDPNHPDDYLYCVDGVWNRTNEYVIDGMGLHMSDGGFCTDYEFDSNGYLFYNYANQDAYPVQKTTPIGPIEGASYDEASNTLTLNNFDNHNAVLNVNLMGNGFKIKLIGENYLHGIVAWGFYYGGSITFTGDGYLNINNPDGKGIVLYAENSESCIMVEETAKLDLNGHYGAIMVYDSTCAKGLYYKGQMYHDAAYEGVHRARGPFAARENGNEKCYSVVDKYNSPMTCFTINYIEDPYDYDYDYEY